MNVENILYLLIFAILFIISTYRSYKKQEAERKKADERRRANVDLPEVQAPAPPVKSKPSFEDILGDLLDLPKPAMDTEPYEHPDVEKYREPKPVEVRNPEPVYKMQAPDKMVRETKYKPEAVEEVQKAIGLHSSHKHQFEFPYATEEPEVEFDLRDAIIKQIILEPKFKA